MRASGRGGTIAAMELYQLTTFIAVAVERNLTRAAERVFTSVPAVSAQVKALEDELGVKLFDRTSKGMALTEAGESLLVEARRTVEAAQRMRAAAAQLRGELSGQVRMGTVSDPVALRLGEVMVRLAERHPQVMLQLQQNLSLRTLAALRRGDLDCAYLMSAQEQIEGMEVRRLTVIDLAVTLTRRQAEAGMPASLEALAKLPWVSNSPECGLRLQQETLFREAGQPFPHGAMADTEGAVRGMVASGLGAGLMRLDQAQAAERAGELVVWPGWRAHTWLCWMAPVKVVPDPAVGAVREAVLEVWA